MSLFLYLYFASIVLIYSLCPLLLFWRWISYEPKIKELFFFNLKAIIDYRKRKELPLNYYKAIAIAFNWAGAEREWEQNAWRQPDSYADFTILLDLSVFSIACSFIPCVNILAACGVVIVTLVTIILTVYDSMKSFFSSLSNSFFKYIVNRLTSYKD